MRHSVSVSLPDKIFDQLKSQCKKDNASGSEIVRAALRTYFFRKKFTSLRKKTLLEATKKGITLTDEEIFKQVS